MYFSFFLCRLIDFRLLIKENHFPSPTVDCGPFVRDKAVNFSDVVSFEKSDSNSFLSFESENTTSSKAIRPG